MRSCRQPLPPSASPRSTHPARSALWAGLSVVLVASAGCGSMASTESAGSGAVIGGLLAIFGTLAVASLVVTIMAVLRSPHKPLLGVAIASWGLLLVHLVGTMLVVESGPVASGLLPWYLQVVVGTSVVPVAGAACNTSLALGQLSEKPKRWMPPLVVGMVLVIHTILMVAFLFARDPYAVISPTPMVEVRVGTEHGCARHEDGTVTCWGRNSEGQLGDGTGQNVDWPVMVQGAFDTVALTVGDGRSCVRSSGGVVSCWGRTESGSATAPVQVASAIIAGPWLAGRRVFAVDASGMVVSGHDQLEPLVPLPPVTLIAAGLRHVCVLLGDGNVSCWGDGQRGQLGGTAEFERLTPTEEDDGRRLALESRVLLPGVSDVVQMVAGDHHTCALRATGAVSCWGVRNKGESQCRDGCVAPGVVEIEGITDAVAISAGDSHTCVVLETGEVACWGDNRWGQLGIGGYRSSEDPQTVLLDEPAVAVFANRYSTCAVLESNDVRCWGANRTGSLGVQELESCRARKILASSECATKPQPLRWRAEQGEEPAE